jgi:7-cyano-7-deazaguanine synthase
VKKVVILYSGGLDSFVMWKIAEKEGYDYKLVHFDIGQPYNEKEMNAIQNLVGDKIDIRKVDWLRSENDLKSKDGAIGNIMIPGRNLTLASLAASIYLPDEIWMGALMGEIHKDATDKNLEFVKKTSDIFKYVFSPYERQPKIVFPLVERKMGKYEEVEWLLNNGVPFEEIEKTSSCLSSEEGKCGTCVVCCRRHYIFKGLGYIEKTNKHPLENKDNIKMILEMIDNELDNKSTHYDEFRKREILPGLKKEFNTDDLNSIRNKLVEKMESLNAK